jgi:hypothetical protein
LSCPPGNVVADSLSTGADGSYDFGLVAPGPYTLQFEQTSTINYAGGASRPVSVVPNATTTSDGVFTGSLIITIANARARAVGAGVTVVGRLTAPPGVFTSGTGGVNSEIWVQDVTGGIAVFSVPSASPLALGDRSKWQERWARSVAAADRQRTDSDLPRRRCAPAAKAHRDEAKCRGNEGRLVSVAGLKISACRWNRGCVHGDR